MDMLREKKGHEEGKWPPRYLTPSFKTLSLPSVKVILKIRFKNKILSNIKWACTKDFFNFLKREEVR